VEFDNDEFQRHAAQYTGAVPRVSSVMKGPVSKVVCCTFSPPAPAAFTLALTLPMMERVPVEKLCAPFAPLPVPASEFPVIFNVPVVLLYAPQKLRTVPPKQFPVMFIIPVLTFSIAP
jgi:hypothetical protein